MSEADEFDPSTADGGALRQRYEAVLKDAKDAKAELAILRAGAVIADKGYKYVKASDLAGVAPSDVEAKATEIEAAKTAERTELLKSSLAENGVDADDVNDGLAELLGRSQHDSQAQLSRLNGVGGVGGTVPPVHDTRGLHGVDRIEGALAKTHRAK
jgi:hypothetical protein